MLPPADLVSGAASRDVRLEPRSPSNPTLQPYEWVEISRSAAPQAIHAAASSLCPLGGVHGLMLEPGWIRLLSKELRRWLSMIEVQLTLVKGSAQCVRH